MPEPKEYIDQLQAYALGCLNKTEFNNLRNYIHSGKDYSWQELGEYQNLAALLPCILNIEIPEPELKDNVARKLYRIRDEIRSKRTADLTNIIIPEPSEEEKFAEPQQEESFAEPQHEEQPDLTEEDTYTPEEEPIIEALREEEEPERDSIDQEDVVEDFAVQEIEEISEAEPPVEEEPKLQYQQPEFEIVTPIRKTSEFFSTPGQEHANHGIPGQQFKNQEEKFYTESDPINRSYTPEDNLQYIIKEETTSSGTKNNTVIYITLALLLLVIAGGVYAYLQISNEVKGYKTEVGKLNTEIKNLTAEPEVNKELQKMLELPDTRTINLTPSNYNPGGFGKVIINPLEGAGYLQMGGMPAQVFSLWISSGRNHILLGSFNGAGAVQYFRFDLPELGRKQKFFLLTPEAAPGAEKPGKQIYLSGTF